MTGIILKTIEAMRLQAEIAKERNEAGLGAGGPAETWRLTGAGRVQEWESSLGNRRRIASTAPRPGTFEYFYRNHGVTK